MSKVKIGWSQVDITPEKGTKISLQGQFFERITDEVESPIAVTAFAVESGNDQMVICGCDLVAVSNNMMQIVREKLSGKIDLPLEKIIISAIHTHTSWKYTQTDVLNAESSFQYLKKIVPPEMEYQNLVSSEECVQGDEALDFLTDRIALAVKTAWENRTEGLYQNAFGRAAVGMNRRVCYDDGSAKMWGDTNHPNFTRLEGGNDNGIELIYTFDMQKNLTGVVANIACPAQVVEQRSYISSDYFGKVRESLQEKFGKDVCLLGLVSPAGDQCPRDMIRWVEPETPIDDPNVERIDPIERRADPSMFDVKGLKLVGKRIFNEIVSVYEELEDDYKDEGILVHETLRMDLPLRRVTIKEYNESVEAIDRFIEKNRGKRFSFKENAALHIYSGNIARYELQKKHNLVPEEIHVIRFGDIAIATNPFELFLDYGNRIRARSKAKQTILIQLCCGSEGYLPTKEAESGSHYSAYISSGFIGHEGGEILVRETLEHINKMF